MIEDAAELLDEFKREIMPKTLAAIRAHKADYSEDWQRERRTEYLKGRMEDLIFKTFYLMQDYDELQKGNDIDSRLFVGGQIAGAIKTVRKLQGEVIALRDAGKKNGKGRLITEDMIERAKEHPIENLLPTPLKMGRCACPIHGGQNVMSFSVKDNRGRCFSCGWPNGKAGDTIQLLMDTQGLTFPDAVKRLQ